MHFKHIVTENLPRWYGISWRPKNHTLIVSVNKAVLTSLKPIPNDSPIAEHFKTMFSFSEFEESVEKNFGFDKSLVRSEKNGLIEFEARLPKVMHILDKNCRGCNGSGKDKMMGNKCLYCFGRKKEREFRWKPAYAMSASLNILLGLLEYSEVTSTSTQQQLITLVLHTRSGQHGGSLGGNYGIPLVG